jgi:hypothetical protein
MTSSGRRTIDPVSRSVKFGYAHGASRWLDTGKSARVSYKITRHPMKLKAPEGVGDPCVAGVVIASREGVYEVEAEIGALLIECFGFVDASAEQKAKAAPRRPRAGPKKTAAED